MDIKERFYGKLQESREQLNELRGKGTLDKKDKEKLQGRIRKKHGKAWTETERIRKEKGSKGSADTKHMDKFRNRLAKMHNKLDEEQLDETDKMKLPKGYGKILPRDDVKNRKVLKKSNMDKRAAKAGMNVPKGYGDIVTYKEEAEQLDAKKKSDKKDKLFLRSRKMIAVSKLDRNRNRNKDNRSTPDLSSKIKKNLKTSNLDRNRKRNKNNRQD